MAYQFGAASKLTSALSATNTLRSYAFWFYQTANGGGNFGRIFDKREGSDPARERFYAATTFLKFRREYTTTSGEWSIDQPSLNAWHHCVITYDASNILNQPVVYIDKIPVTVTETITPVGTLRPDNASNYVWGNDGTATDYYWAGRLAEGAIFDGILSAADVVDLYEGLLASDVGTAVSHCPMYDDATDFIIADATATSLTVVAHPDFVGGVGIGAYDSVTYGLSWKIQTGVNFGISWNILDSASYGVNWNILGQTSKGVSWKIDGQTSYGVSWVLDGKHPEPQSIHPATSRNNIFNSTFRQSVFYPENR